MHLFSPTRPSFPLFLFTILTPLPLPLSSLPLWSTTLLTYPAPAFNLHSSTSPPSFFPLCHCPNNYTELIQDKNPQNFPEWFCSMSQTNVKETGSLLVRGECCQVAFLPAFPIYESFYLRRHTAISKRSCCTFPSLFCISEWGFYMGLRFKFFGQIKLTKKLGN